MNPLIIDLLAIAVIPVVAKVLEKIVSTQLSMYLQRNNLLHHISVLIIQESLLRIFCYWQLIRLLHHWIKEMLFVLPLLT